MRRLFRKAAPTALTLGLFVGVGVLIHACFPSIAYAQEDFLWSSTLVTWIGSILAQIVNWLGDMMGSLTLMIIEVVVVNVLNYNNFSNSTIVTLGWILTRDMVNMFAVIVLLILAVKTMIGQGGSAWQQHLPRFFLGIVAANFSRTLCGLAIDASQVVMMTFVNALMSIAAGNFAQLMVMPQATTYSSETFQGATEAGITLVTLASNIANAYAKLLVQVAVMIVILLMAIAFIWRIIVLWIALIMAPIAGFSWGSKEIVGFLGRFYSEWMGAFVPPLVLGPMLAFFLYLALAASSNGNLAEAEAFPEPEERTTYGQITLEIFESTNFTGLLLAIVFLLMGLQESAKVAAKMGGLASMALNDKTGRRVLTMGARVSGATVGNVAKLGTRAGLKGVSALGSGIELAGDRLGTKLGGRAGSLVAGAGMVGGAFGSLARRADEQVRMVPTDASKLPGYAKNRAAAMAKAGSELTTKLGGDLSRGIAKNVKSPHLAAALNALGPNALLAAGSALHTQEHHVSEAEAKAAKDRVGHMTDAEKAMRLQQFLDGTGEKSLEAFADAQHLKGMLFTDKNFEKNFKGATGGKFEGHVQEMLSQFQHEADAGHLSIDKEAWNKARSKYADIYAKVDAGKAAGFIDSEDFNGRLMREQAAGDTAVIAALGAASTGKTENGRVVTKLDELHRGNYGGENVRAAVPSAVAAGNVESLTKLMERGGAERLQNTNLTNSAVIESLIKGRANVGDVASEEIAAQAAAHAAGGPPPTVTAASVQQQFVTQVMNTQEVENITKSFDNGQYNESHLSDAMFDSATNANADKAVQAMARAQNVDFSKMTTATRDQINRQLAAMETAGGRISNDDASALRQKLIAAGKTIPQVLPGVDPNPTSNPTMSLTGNERLKTQQLFKADPSTIRQVQAAVRQAVTSGGKNDFTKTVVEGLSKEDFNKLADMMRKETDVAKKRAIKDAMDTIGAALSVHERSATSPDEVKRLRGLRSAHSSADRYMTV